MTTLQTAAQQALEAWQTATYGHPSHHKATLLSMTALSAALAQQATEPETCTWHQDGDSDSGLYGTSCGRFFDLTDGTPETNKMSWCCYCGKKLVQELIAEETK